MQHTSCRLCGSDDYEAYAETTDYISGERFQVTRCKECGLVYVNPRPSLDKIAHYYPQTHQSSQPAAYERADARQRLRFIRRLCPSGSARILDVGCGKGVLLGALRDQGWDAYGTELSEPSSRVAVEQGLTVYNRPVEDSPFQPESFDVITLFHSLEHLPDPPKTLKHLFKLLRPKGYLVVEVPNVGSWYARAFGGVWFHFDVPRHLFHFTPQTLQRALNSAGFHIIEEHTHNVQYDAFGAVQSILNLVFRQVNLLNNVNTGEVTIKQLWHQPRRLRSLGALAGSELGLMVGFPLFSLVSVLTKPWAEGGTLRFVATRLSHSE